jgi:hypothetical protein
MRGDADLYNLIILPTNKPFKLQSCLNRLLRPRRGKRELRGDASSCCVGCLRDDACSAASEATGFHEGVTPQHFRTETGCGRAREGAGGVS